MAEIEPIVGRYVKLKIAGEDYRIYFEEAGEGIPLLCLILLAHMQANFVI